ncbi:hypothetical protein BRD03_01160 [Halobacteriales archaeon QS_9_68_17]|nr:MAG: hypothetical protein BRD03_01160 [Halobacteriales archaeon QS_9_68_17]
METFGFQDANETRSVSLTPVETALPTDTDSVSAKRVREITSHGLSDAVRQPHGSPALNERAKASE